MPPSDVHRVFDRFARHYDTDWLQRALYMAVQDRALAELRPLQPASILDAGCGTGIFAGRLTREQSPAFVSGCDLSAGMLAEAAARTRDVAWIRGDAAHFPIRADAMDAVICTQAFHFFDQPSALTEFRRILSPGGHAMIGMVNPKTRAASLGLTKLVAAVSKMRSTWPTCDQLRQLFTEAGFEAVGQHEVRWAFGQLFPLVVTVGRAPTSGKH
jgi:ubiquinone/menaquinone biosynthesis C-methylase UbiE